MSEDNVIDEPERAATEMTFRDYYEVNPPFGFVGIALDEEAGKLRYLTLEPTLTEEEQEILTRLKGILIERMDIPLSVLKDEESMEAYLRDQIQRAFRRFKRQVAKESEDKYIYYLKRDFLGYGKIDLLMLDPNIEDISCNGLDTPLYIWHRNHESIPTNISYESPAELDAIVTRLAYKAGRQISVARPILEGTLPEGYRVHLTLDEVSTRGDTFTIRKFRHNPYTIVDLIRFGTVSASIAAYLWVLVDNLRSVMISGATASGKTTLLNSVCMFVRPEMKVVTIEEVRELRLHENWIPMVPRPSFQPGVDEVTLFDLLRSALRQRPDYIIVGEVRGEEAYTLFQSIATGHGGLCTIHSDTVDSVIKRLLTEPMNIPPLMFPLMNVVLQIRRVKVGDAVVRRATSVTEITGVTRDGVVETQERFTWNPEYDRYDYIEPHGDEEDCFSQISKTRHIRLEQLFKEHERRETIISWMVNRGINTYDEVAKVVRNYYVNPDEVYNAARLGLDG